MDYKKIISHPLGLIAAFFILLFIFDRLGFKFPVSVITQDKGAPLVVEGTGKVTAVPDIAKVSVGIEESGTTLETVQNSADKKSKNLVEALKKLGIAEKDIKTTNYSVYPEYDYQERTPRIRGYRVNIAYEVKVKDFEKVNEIIAGVTSAGANLIGSVSFEVNEETKNKKLTEAREEAVRQAKEKAESLAKAAGIKLGRILNISEAVSTPVPVPLKEAGLGGAPITSPEITPGETEITSTVSVSWEIK